MGEAVRTKLQFNFYKLCLSFKAQFKHQILCKNITNKNSQLKCIIDMHQ